VAVSGMSAVDVKHILFGYMEAYKRLYNRYPRNIEAILGDWVIIGGARMHITEVEHLTARLRDEYSHTTNQKRTLVNRLIAFFKR
jgi:hypothetical protein